MALLTVIIASVSLIFVEAVAEAPKHLAKIDPAAWKLLEEKGKVKVIVFMKELPSDVYSYLLRKGDRVLAIKTLKEWASKIQSRVLGRARMLAPHYGAHIKVLNRFWIVDAVLVEVDKAGLELLASMPEVVKIVPNIPVFHVPKPVAVKKLGALQQVSSWGIFKIRAPEVWAKGITGEGVRICVLDTGVDITHPALQGKMLTIDPNDPHYPGGWMEFDENGNPVLSTPHDTHGHGTHVSGTALGGDTQNILIGVAPGATLMHGLVLPGGSGTFAQVFAGMQWCVEPFYIDPDTGQQIPTNLPAHVVSMSFGASGYYGNDLLPAIENMLLAQIVPVAAIGNEGPGTSSNPGNIWGVIGVGATDQNDNVAYFSSGEVVNWPNPPSDWPFFGGYPSTYIKPDVSAPGVDITSAVPGGGYEAWSGTSMATPHVSGTVALILQAMDALNYKSPDPRYSIPELVYLILNSTAIDLGDPGQDTRYGWGRIDAYAAVEKALQYAKKSGVEGCVYDAVSGEPITWAEVTVLETGETYKVNASGCFRIPLDPGTYHLNVSAWGYYYKIVEVNVTLLNGTIEGWVKDALTGQGIPNASVTVVELNATTYTNATGFYSIEVPPGTYTVVASAPGYQNQSTVVTVDENQTVVLNFTLYPSANGTIVAHVYDNATQLAIEGALVKVIELNVTAVTNASGVAEISVPAGNYSVEASAPGYQSQTIYGVLVGPNQYVHVEFYLQPLPPTVAVVGNGYYGNHHIAQILAAAGLSVKEYSSIDDLLQELQSGNPNNIKAIVIDHWYDSGDTPSSETVLSLLQLADQLRIGLVFLGAPYAGETGMRALYDYADQIEAAGYPAPDTRFDAYPSPNYVYVVALAPTHPIFDGIDFDGPVPYSFYVANLSQSSYCDYVAYNFTDDTGIVVLGLIRDDSYNVVGAQVALWNTSINVTWIYISTGAESYWMKYLEPGSDGQYSDNLAKLLVNAVKLSLQSAVSSTKLGTKIEICRGPWLGISIYTYIEVYLDRKPYGWVEGWVRDTQGNPIPGATVRVLGTPVVMTTDEEGHFKYWLPEGTYVLEIEAAGYRSKNVTVTIEVNKTTTVSVELQRTLRVAIAFDYGSQLKQVLAEMGWYVVDYNDWNALYNDISTGFYDALIVAGYPDASAPSKDLFTAVLKKCSELGMGVVFLDSWGNYPYGINLLHMYYNDPAVRGYGYGDGVVYYVVLEKHPIFAGIDLEEIPIIAGGDYDYAYFDQFSGTYLAQLKTAEKGVVGYGVAIKEVNGSKWVLLAALAPQQWTNVENAWTDYAKKILINAVLWSASKPLNVTLEPSVAVVGQIVEVTVTGAAPNAVISLYLDGRFLANVTSDASGKAVYSFRVPLITGGEHLIEAESWFDKYYYGYAYLYVRAALVGPDQVKQGEAVEFTLTGVAAYKKLYVLIDNNLIGFVATNSSGAATIVINVPLCIEVGKAHVLKVIDVDSLELVATKELTVIEGATLSKLSEVSAKLSEALSTLRTMISGIDTLQRSVAAVRDLVMSLDSKIGSAVAKIEALSNAVESKLRSMETTVSGLESKLGSKIEELGKKIESVETELGSVESNVKSVGSEVKELKNAVAEVKSCLEKLNASVEIVNSGIEALKATIDEELGAVSKKVENVGSELSSKIESVGSKIENVEKSVVSKVEEVGTSLSDTVEKSVDELKDLIEKVKSNVSSVSEKVESVKKDVESVSSKASQVPTLTGLVGAALAVSVINLFGVIALRRR